MKQAREVALDALTACERQGAWSDGYLKKAIGGAKLDGRDAALATRLCFGVLQNRMLLDFYLSKLCATPLHKLEASIRNLLRLGAYQLLYLNRVPDHAAVSEAVSLARKKAKNPRAAGLVNGVLRSLIRQREAMEPPADLSTRYSHPQWLVDSFVARLGREEAEALLAADNGEPPHLCPGKHPQNLRRGAGCHADGRGGGSGTPSLAAGLPVPERHRKSGTPGGVPEGVLFTSRMPPPIWRCWPPRRSRGGGCWTPVQPLEANPSPPLSPWRTGGASPPVIFTPTSCA